MAAPPEKKSRTADSPEEKESNTISMVVPEWAKGQKEQFSSVHRINGYPFRLRTRRLLYGGSLKCAGMVPVSLLCDKSSEAELWKCTATVKYGIEKQFTHVFCSWLKGGWERLISSKHLETGSVVQINIFIQEDGNSFCWNLRPSLDSIKPNDVILVIGEDKKEIRVNKEFLASQSPYFDRLFFGSFSEKNMDRIPIGDVEYEEFHNIIKMIYGSTEAVLTGVNLHNVLDLADRFDLKIVEDRVVNYLMTHMGSCSFTMSQKLLISQERNLPALKNLCLNECPRYVYFFNFLMMAPEYDDFSDALKAEILALRSNCPNRV